MPLLVASLTGIDVFFDKRAKLWPVGRTRYEFEASSMTKVTRRRRIILRLKNRELEIQRVGDIDEVVK